MAKRKTQVPAKDMTGQRFERLVVLGRAPNFTSGSRTVRWHCQCDCGKVTITAGAQLRNGRAKSCGCYAKEAFDKYRTKHGGSRTRLHTIWVAMNQRCGNPRCREFRNYGGRGITVCPEWRNDFAAFAAYMGERPSSEYSIDRIDNDRGYEPGNVRWATHIEQHRNVRRNHIVMHNGRAICLSALAEEVGISEKTLNHRIVNLGWPLEKALVLPRPRRKTIYITHANQTQSLRQWASETGIPYATLKARIDVYQWPVQRALTEPVRRKNSS